MIKTTSKAISNAELTSFGILMSWAFPLFFGVIAPWIFGHSLQWWTLWVSAFFLILAFTSPKLIYFPYKAWMFIAGIIGWINTRMILGFTFYGLIFPLGFILRRLGKLQYKGRKQRQKSKNLKSPVTSSYVIRDEIVEKQRLEQPF